MELLIQSLILFISLVILSKSSHIVSESSVKIAKITRLGELTIGFIVLSLASSAPEIAVAFSAITSGNIGITLGNIFGSNIADILLIPGIMAFLGTIKIYKKSMRELSTILFITSTIPISLLTFIFYSRIVGLMLIFTFLIFCWFSIKSRITFGEFVEKKKEIKLSLALPLAFGLFFLLISSRFVVDSAAKMARLLGVSESVVGATIISIGSVLPELAVSITSIKKKCVALALGNTIGSCIVKVTVVLGFVLLLAPSLVDLTSYSPLISFMLASAILFWFFCGRGELDRTDGIILLLFYSIFLLTFLGVEIAI
jgi:cation:H+ antiporter